MAPNMTFHGPEYISRVYLVGEEYTSEYISNGH